MTFAKQEPLSKKEMKKALANPLAYTKRTLKLGFGKSPIWYYVPKVQQFSAEDKVKIGKALAECCTPTDAHKLISKKAFWSYREVSLVQDIEVGVLRYKNLDVCLFYKRQVDKIEPEPTDPVPTGALEDERDVWVALNLFSKSPRQLMDLALAELKAVRDELGVKTQQLKATETIYLSAHKEILQLKKTQAELIAEVAKLKKNKTKKGKNPNGNEESKEVSKARVTKKG